MTENQILKYLLDYEIRSSLWAGYISNDYLQKLAAKYFAWKVKRKFNRQNESQKIKQSLESYSQVR